jgi:hypothetical protein
MEKLTKLFICGLFLVLGSLASLHAQTASTDSNPAPGPPAAGQASDDMTKKITDLVNAGKYSEAQALTTGLLVAYPNDQRLIKTQSLLKQLSAPAATPSTPGISPSAQPAGDADTARLTGMDKVDYNALIERARQAQQTTDPEQQKSSLQRFLGDSSLFLQKHPQQMLLWQIRAAAAISVNDPDAGYEAAQKLMAAGAADSNDPALQRLLGQLKNNGWLDEQGVKQAKQKIEEGKKYEWLIGTWTGTASWFSKATWDYGKRHRDQRVEFIRSGSSVEGYSYNLSTGTKDSAPSFKYSTFTLEGMNLPTNWRINGRVPNPEWQPITSCAVSNDRTTITIVALGRTFVFTKIGDLQSQ